MIVCLCSMERLKPEFHKSRWLEAIWEPGARIYSLPGGIDMIDISGDGDARLITIDLGNSIQDTARVCLFSFELNKFQDESLKIK